MTQKHLKQEEEENAWRGFKYTNEVVIFYRAIVCQTEKELEVLKMKMLRYLRFDVKGIAHWPYIFRVFIKDRFHLTC